MWKDKLEQQENNVNQNQDWSTQIINQELINVLKKEQDYIEIAGLKVMKENLRVNSNGWKEIKMLRVHIHNTSWISICFEKEKVKVNPEWDIWEYIQSISIEWKRTSIKEQFFTKNSAVRESEKQWLRMLTWWEWEKILSEVWWESNKEQSMNTIKKLKLNKCGAICDNNILKKEKKDDDDDYAFSWLLENNKDIIAFEKNRWLMQLNDSRSLCVPVRCVKN